MLIYELHSSNTFQGDLGGAAYETLEKLYLKKTQQQKRKHLKELLTGN